MTYLLDTNMLIYFLNGQLSTKSYHFVRNVMEQHDWQISIISKIELLGFRFEHAQHKRFAEELLINCRFIPLTEAVAEKAILLRQSYKLKTPDAVIAATSILYHYTLVSRNDKDFLQIENMPYYNPIDEVV